MLTESFYPWATPLFIAQIPLAGQQQATILEIIETSSAQQTSAIDSQIAPSAKHNLIESDLHFLDHHQQVEAIQALKNTIVDHLSLCIQEANASSWPENHQTRTTLIESWYHVTQKGGYHDIHAHPNCSWCGIYCLENSEADFETKSGINRFYDPRHHANLYQDAGSLYINDEGVWDIALQAGQAVFFPSYIKHSALPYQGDKPRIIIAFNSQTDFIETVPD